MVNELETIKTNDLTEQSANELRMQMRNEPQVLQIVDSMDLRNQNQLLSLGREPAERLSSFSDRILKTMTLSKIDESGQLLIQLEKLMKRFDKNEILKEPNFIAKLFKKAKATTEALFKKYQTLGGELDKIHKEFAIIED